MNLRYFFRTAIRYWLDYGLLALLKRISYLLQKSPYGLIFGKVDVLGIYDFARLPYVSPALGMGQASANTINWVIPPFGKGGGGHINIFRFVSYLEKMGFECRIIIVGSWRSVSAAKQSERAQKEITKWFFPLAARVYMGMENAPPAYYTIASTWRTAYAVRNFGATRHRCYFIQDFEPWFCAAGAEYALAEDTYRFGFVGITAGTWLKSKIATDYGMETYSVGFSYDRDIYRQMPRREPDDRRVFFYARPSTPHRGFELGLLVLAEVVRRLPDIKVVFAGLDLSNYYIPFEHQNAGLVSLSELPSLYCQCDVALVLSFTNLSLLPLEIMACGTPVVSNKGPWTEWLLNDHNACLANPTIDALANAVCSVLSDPVEANRLREGGFAAVAVTDWQVEACAMAGILRGLAQATNAAENNLQEIRY